MVMIKTVLDSLRLTVFKYYHNYKQQRYADEKKAKYILMYVRIINTELNKLGENTFTYKRNIKEVMTCMNHYDQEIRKDIDVVAMRGVVLNIIKKLNTLNSIVL